MSDLFMVFGTEGAKGDVVWVIEGHVLILLLLVLDLLADGEDELDGSEDLLFEVFYEVWLEVGLQGGQLGVGEVVCPVVHLVYFLFQAINTLQLTLSWVCSCLKLKTEGVCRYWLSKYWISPSILKLGVLLREMEANYDFWW